MVRLLLACCITLVRSAPSAMRIPISLVRWATASMRPKRSLIFFIAASIPRHFASVRLNRGFPHRFLRR